MEPATDQRLTFSRKRALSTLKPVPPHPWGTPKNAGGGGGACEARRKDAREALGRVCARIKTNIPVLPFEFWDEGSITSRTMPKRKSDRPEILSRNVEFFSYRMSVGLRAVHQRGVDPYIETQPWLELKGRASEPVRDVKDVVISLYPKDELVVGTSRPAACGAIVGARPLCTSFSRGHT